MFNARMKTNEEIRAENLAKLIIEAGGEERLSELYECSPAFIKQMARGYRDSKSGSQKGIGNAAARRLEIAMKKDRGWLDHDHERPMMVMQQSFGYGQSLSEIEMEVIEAFRAANEAQRSIVISWARANKPPSFQNDK